MGICRVNFIVRIPSNCWFFKQNHCISRNIIVLRGNATSKFSVSVTSTEMKNKQYKNCKHTEQLFAGFFSLSLCFLLCQYCLNWHCKDRCFINGSGISDFELVRNTHTEAHYSL